MYHQINMCQHNFVNVRNTYEACVNCGVMRKILVLDTFCIHASPLGRNYDRLQRFTTKLDRLLGMGSMPKYEDPVWKVLENATMTNPADVRTVLRNSRLVHKHYDCVKPFCDMFTTFRCPPVDVLGARNALVRRFKFVKSLWGMRDGFFSYDWLLRKFLEDMNSPLVVYLKKPTNKRREQKYQKWMKEIIAEDDGRTWNRNFVDDRSQSG